MAVALPRMPSPERLAPIAERGRAGRGWYGEALEQIGMASDMLGCTPVKLAGYLAVYSPRVSVKRSIRMAYHRIRTGEHTHDCMRGVQAAVEHWEATGEIRGPKTRAFNAALLGDESAVVLDVWMARALGIPQDLLGRITVYRKGEDRIRSVASVIGWTPAETQAALWVATVEAAGRNPGQIELVRETLYGRELVI